MLNLEPLETFAMSILKRLSLLFALICFSIPLMTTVQADEPDLDAYLIEHPLVSQALRWEDSNGIRAYSNWSATLRKTDLYTRHIRKCGMANLLS